MSKRYPLLSDYDWLYTKYIKEELSTTAIAKIVGCSFSTVSYALEKKDAEAFVLLKLKKAGVI